MSPIIYKIIPTQYAFYMEKKEGGMIELKQQQVTTIPKSLLFKDKKDVLRYIKNYRQQL